MTKEQSLTFAAAGDWYLRIDHTTGKITLNPKFPQDEAVREFVRLCNERMRPAVEPRGDVKGATFGCHKCGTTVTLEFTDATRKSVAIGPMNGWIVGPDGCFCPQCAVNRTGES